MAFHSYSIVKLVAASALLTVVIWKYYVDINLTLPVVALFFFIEGVFVGYVIAYYSIKYLRTDGIKEKLPQN